jgi:hypothetical protein
MKSLRIEEPCSIHQECATCFRAELFAVAVKDCLASGRLYLPGKTYDTGPVFWHKTPLSLKK